MKNEDPLTTISFNKGKVKVVYSVFSKDKENGKQICLVPGLNLMYSANNDQEVLSRSASMIKTYINYYLKEDSFKNLAKELNRLGFKAPLHQYTLSQILNNRTKTAKFKSIPEHLPGDFKGARVHENRLEEIEL